MTMQFGGTFAPPLTDEKLTAYKMLIDGLEPSYRRDSLLTLLNCSSQWWEQPESTGNRQGIPHASGIGIVIDLDEPIKKALWDHIPYKEELDMMQADFDKIPFEQKDLRNCAFHLWWHAKELEMDREPLTNDKL